MARKIEGSLKTLVDAGAVIVIDGVARLRVGVLEADGSTTVKAFPMSEITEITATQVFNYMYNIDPAAAKKAKFLSDLSKQLEDGVITQLQYDAFTLEPVAPESAVVAP